jgi:redox-sensitive bicupin YhaK (pirin superfamily)
MRNIIHTADSRGRADHGWLQARHTFSFSRYHDPQRMGFGALRVINDDIIAGGGGFPTHGHDNMEIITVPLQGGLAHKDSMGSSGVINAGDVQVMSAGTGLTHSEFNASETETANTLQIWVLPEKQDVTPRYDQATFDPADRHNRWQLLVSPDGANDSLWVNQQTWFSRARLDAGQSLGYVMHRDNSGAYLFLIDGQVSVADQVLAARDGMGIYDTRQFSILSNQGSDVLLMEVPIG